MPSPADVPTNPAQSSVPRTGEVHDLGPVSEYINNDGDASIPGEAGAQQLIQPIALDEIVPVVPHHEPQPRNEETSVISVRSSDGSEDSSQSPLIKRRRVKRDLKTRTVENVNGEDSQDDGNCCTICLERWSNTGPHQVCCMPCGHLFGYKCIKEWILGSNSRRRACPTCKVPARVKDLRYLFGLPSRLEASDVSEVQRLREQLTKEKTSHERTKMKLEETKRLAKTYRAEIKSLQRHKKSSIQTFGNEKPPDNDDCSTAVRLISVYKTLGASVSVALDQDATYLFNERVSPAGTRHRIGRVDIGRPQTALHSPHTIEKRVNSIEICRDTSRADFRHISIASTDCKVYILASNLQHATTISTPRSIPLSSRWLSCRPNLIAVGMVSGEVFIYDVRQTVTALYGCMLSRDQGARAVHSLHEVYAENTPVVLAASPLGIYGLVFDGYVDRPTVHPINGLAESLAPSSLTVSDNIIAVAAKGRSNGLVSSQQLGSSLSVHKGLSKQGPDIRLGDALGDQIYGNLQTVPFAFGGLVRGADDYAGTILAYPDKLAKDKLSAWTYKKGTNATGRWTEQEVQSQGDGCNSLDSVADVRAAVGIRLPRHSRIRGVPEKTRGIFVTVGNDVVRVFAAGKYV
ncbi:E3 ubiquitin-protein ligase RFWD3 [Gracilariopsis chorda]|uniref:E3 ubiquitin-protein ligase RFWD3 n=1 Tax=Gracilariopsis chorda TaxID=448386 RepID=A0A2V3IPY8_9FLOR|nr:E3 ubiquitin-protein ligase RFWD3 [Gracilariopsis chorda]|eukprot:PXF44113.1 E3 ubiquitin-protein ligase RFWD3 [Gracilariopsis chorda]